MMEEVTAEVQAMFPNETINASVFVTIYYAAKLNHSKQLVATLNTIKNQNLRNFLINLRFDEVDGQSITPLTIAAIAGNTKFIHTLLTQYDIDIEQECNVIFDGLVVYGATALWVAAGMGHLQIVKLLVQRGANINHNTKAQSSPLRAACYEGRLDIVKYLIQHGANVNLANNYNNTSLMIAAYKGHVDVVATLLQNGADPNMQALCKATALHYAAECGHVDVCKLLLENGAVFVKNEHSMTPILVAAEHTQEGVVNMFLEHPQLLSNEEVIEALELLGASFGNDKDNYDIEKAYIYLEHAMEMRFADSNNIMRKEIMRPVAAYDNWVETESVQELRAIRLNHHSMHMECLTVRERILGRTNPELPQPIVYRGAIMADQRRFEHCLKLWSYALDLRMANNVSVDRDLLRFVQLFSQILRTNPQKIDLHFVLTILMKCQLEIQNNRIKISKPGPKDVPRLLADQNEQNLMVALYLIKIITRLHVRTDVPNRPRKNIEYLYSILMTLIQQDPRLADGQSLLHLAVNGITPVDDFYTNDVCKFPCEQTALLLLNAGAHVSAVDCDRNNPLHKLVDTYQPSQDPPRNLARVRRIIKMFVDAGVHLDAVNKHGLTAAQLAGDPHIESYILSFQNARITLKCLAARCIAFHRIPYKGMIPASLESFIQVHSTDKMPA